MGAVVRQLMMALGRACLLLAGLLAAVPAAQASTTFDIRGSWGIVSVAGGTYTGTEVYETEDLNTGAVTGHGSGGGYTWPISVTLNGNSYTATDGPYDQLPGYTSHSTGTVSADGKTITGTFTDTFGHSGTFTLSRISGPPGGGPGSNGVPTSTSVVCNRGPNPGDDSVCAIAVNGQSGHAPPTGSVHVVTHDGGTFRGGGTCTLAPASGLGVASGCTVTYIPPAGGGFPSLTASYGGDSTYASSSGDASYKTAGYFGLPPNTPVEPQACEAANPDAGSAADPGAGDSERLGPRFNATHQNPLTSTDQVTAGDFANYCATNFVHNVAGGLVRLGQGTALAAGATLSVGGVLVSTLPGVANKAAGGVMVAGGPAVGYLGYQAGEKLIELNDKALNDPPDPRFKTIARPRRYPRFSLLAGNGFSRSDAARLTKLVADEQRLAALAEAMGATIDKVGGARKAGSKKYQGIQTRISIGYAHQLVPLLNALPAQIRAGSRIIARVRLFSRPLSASLLKRAQRAHKLTAGVVRFLHAIGLRDPDIVTLQAASRHAKIGSGTPRSVAAALADPALAGAYGQAAKMLRFYPHVGSVAAAAALH